MSIQAVQTVRVGADAPRASSAGTAPPGPRPAGSAPAPEAREAPQAPRARSAAQADPAPDPQAVAQTTGYVQQLLTAQVLGGADDHPARPAHITPERLAAFVECLEGSLRARAGATVVDVTG